MFNTQNLFNELMDVIDYKEQEYLDNLDMLEEKKLQEEYITILEKNNIHDIYALLDYYSKLKCNTEKIGFQRFVSSIIQEADETESFFEEVRNLTLLRRTGLLKYATEQENYSKRIIGNFLLKFGTVKEELKKENIKKQIKEVHNKLDSLREYKPYFAPIGIVKEVEKPTDFHNFLKYLNLSNEERKALLLMAFRFNKSYHDKKLKSYTLDLQENKTLIQRKIIINKKDMKNIISFLKNNDIRKYLHQQEEEIEILDDSYENPYIFQAVDYDEATEELFEKASESLKKHPDKDPYDLFLDYYTILLGNHKKDDDIKVIEKAKKYLNSHMKLINGLNDISKQDLDYTLKVYKEDESLREEVYKTTENVERLITYEIKNIFETFDKDDSESIVKLSKKLKPSITYLDTMKKKNTKKK